jgi:Ankyrin repeats (3 copies)
MQLPAGIDLDQYKKQAKELLRAARSGVPEALARLAAPTRRVPQPAGSWRLADAQFAVGRENGFSSWARFQKYLVFRNALAALDAGDERRLAALLAQHPDVVGYKCRLGPLYEEGYFAGATLVHHLAGNPDRGPLPSNVLAIAELLLRHGVDRRAGEETIGLLLTSRRASEAGVALPLIDRLAAAGIAFDPHAPDVLDLPLLNVAPATASALVARGAGLSLRHAAAFGDVAALERLLGHGAAAAELDRALAFASIRGERAAVELLLRHGARGGVLVTPGGQTPRTALHEAASRGHREIVAALLAGGAEVGTVEPRWGGTAADWAEHGGHHELAQQLREELAKGR